MLKVDYRWVHWTLLKNRQGLIRLLSEYSHHLVSFLRVWVETTSYLTYLTSFHSNVLNAWNQSLFIATHYQLIWNTLLKRYLGLQPLYLFTLKIDCFLLTVQTISDSMTIYSPFWSPQVPLTGISRLLSKFWRGKGVWRSAEKQYSRFII